MFTELSQNNDCYAFLKSLIHYYVVAVVFWLCGIFIISICSSLSYHDGEDVLRSALVVQSASRVDDSVVRVDAEEPHAAGVNAALEAKGQTVTLVAVRRQHLNHLSIRGRVFCDCDVIGGLGKNRGVVVVVQNCNVDL